MKAPDNASNELEKKKIGKHHFFVKGTVYRG